MQTHKPFAWIAGDDWRLFIQLLDEDNRPYDLNGVEIRWLLHNPSGEQVPHDHLTTIIDAAQGRLSIWIPHGTTTAFVGGMWTDWLRIMCNGIVSTLLTGNINVTADPWRAPVAVAPTMMVGQSFGDVVGVLEHERIKRKPRRKEAATATEAANNKTAIHTDSSTEDKKVAAKFARSYVPSA